MSSNVRKKSFFQIDERPIFKYEKLTLFKRVFGLSGAQPPAPIKFSTSSTSSYLKSSYYDHVHISFNGLRVI